MNKDKISDLLTEDSIFLAMCDDDCPLLINFDDPKIGVIVFEGDNSKELLRYVFGNGVLKSNNYMFLYFGKTYFEYDTKESNLKYYNIASYENQLEPFLLKLIEKNSEKKFFVLLEDSSILTNKVVESLPGNKNIKIACATRSIKDVSFHFTSLIWETEYDGLFTFGNGSVTFDLNENKKRF